MSDAPLADGDCPPLELLEELIDQLLGDHAPSDPVRMSSVATIRGHMERCDRCRRRIEQMRQANEFIGRFVDIEKKRSGFIGRDSGGLDCGEPDHADVAFDEHGTFPGYIIREIVAVGGQGVVYRAEQIATDRVVAIKVPVGDAIRRPAKRYRFRREIELTARLRHPSIVDVLGVCEARDGRIGCVMEFVEGVGFEAWSTPRRRNGDRASVRTIVEAVRAVAQAIAHAHQHAVLHRDIKPSNVIVTADGSPRVLDFGLAKAIDDGSSSFKTVTGAFVGTLAFAAPEQIAEGREVADVRTDVHGLGMLLYTALTGAPPWNVDAPTVEVLHAIRDAVPARPTRRLAQADGELDAITLKALAKERTRRYQSAAEFADDLGRWLDGEAVRARFDSRWYVVRKTLWRRRRLVATVAMLLAAAGIMAELVIDSRAARHREAIARERANSEALRSLAVAAVMRSVAPAGDLMFGDEFAGRLAMGVGDLGVQLEVGVYANDPAYEAALLMAIGSMFANTPTLAGHGEVYVRRALFARLAKHGDDHPEVASGLHDLAMVLFARRRYQEAEARAGEAIVIRRRHHGETHPLTAASHELRARARLHLRDPIGALEDVESAASALGTPPAGPALATSIRRTAAEAHAALGAVEPAWSNAVDALRVAVGGLVDEDPLVAQAVIVAGTVAERCHGELPPLATALKLTSWSALSHELLAVGDLLEGRISNERVAESTIRSERLERLLALRVALLGREHFAVGTNLARLAHANSMCDGAIAIDRYAQAIPILVKELGVDHPAVAHVRTRMAAILSTIGQSAEAAHQTRLTIEAFDVQPARERDEQSIAVAYLYLVRFELAAGLNESAVESGREAMSRLAQLFGEEHHAHALAQAMTACALSELGAHDEAVSAVRDAWRVALASAATPPDQRALIEAAFGAVLCRAGFDDEGRPPLRAALEVLLPLHDDGRLDRFVTALVESYRRCGEVAEAEATVAWRSSIRGLRPARMLFDAPPTAQNSD